MSALAACTSLNASITWSGGSAFCVWTCVTSIPLLYSSNIFWIIACDSVSIADLPSVKIGWILLLAITSLIAVSAAAFTVPWGSWILNKNFPASFITQKTEKSILTIFSSPVNIRLSSGTSATPEEVKPVSLSDLNPISILFTFVTFGVSALSTGKGIW